MTSAEMDNEFLVLYDKITNNDAPGYTQEERSIFLTKGQERTFLSLYSQKGNLFQEGFENTEARRKDLKELVKGVTITTPSATQTNVKPNGVFYDLPSDCLYAINEEVTISSSDTCVDGNRIEVRPVTHDEYNKSIKNPFKKPSPELAWRMDYQGKVHEIITDGTYTITSYHLRYIKRPQPIIVGNVTIDGVAGPLNCELDEILHKRIIDEAVKIATGITDPQLYQIKTIEQKESEQ